MFWSSRGSPSWAVEDSAFQEVLSLGHGCHTRALSRLHAPASGTGRGLPLPLHGLAEHAHRTQHHAEAGTGRVESLLLSSCPPAFVCSELCTRGPRSRSHRKSWGGGWGACGGPSRPGVHCWGLVFWAASSGRGTEEREGGGRGQREAEGDLPPPVGAAPARGARGGRVRGPSSSSVASRAQGRAGRVRPSGVTVAVWCGERRSL